MAEQGPLGLNVDVADRQAFGTTYGRPKALQDRTAMLQSGVLRLLPHPDWEGDVTDWTADPFEDRNWRFQHHTLRWLSPLRWSALDGDEDSRRRWLEIVRSWAEVNLPPQRRSNDFAWKDMADGTRALELSLGARLVSAEETWFVPLLEVHRDWLLDEDNFVRGNHGLHQLTGLFVVSSVLGDTTAVNTCIARLENHFLSSFDAQGTNNEGSTNYHVLNMSWWQGVWSRLTLEGHAVPAEAQARLEAAGQALAHISHPDGSLPQIGDGGRRRVPRGVHPMLDYLDTGGNVGYAPTDTAVALERGYAVMRSGWGAERPLDAESHAVMRFGMPGGGHAHHDLGSLNVYSAGRRWLVDSGFYSYETRGDIRPHLKSRAAHNLPLIIDKDYNHEARVSLERLSETDDYIEVGLEDPGYGDVTIRRRVLYLQGADCWLIWDQAVGSSPVQLVQHWHTDVGLKARVHDRGFELYDDQATFLMTWLGSQTKRKRHKAIEGDLSGWVGTRWKTLEPGIMLTAQSSASRPELVLLAAASAPHELAVVRSFLNTSGVLNVRLMRGPRVWHLEVSPGHAKVRELDRHW